VDIAYKGGDTHRSRDQYPDTVVGSY